MHSEVVITSNLISICISYGYLFFFFYLKSTLKRYLQWARNESCNYILSNLLLLFFFFFFTFYFVLGYSELTKNVIVTDEQKRDSVIHVHVSVLPQTPLLSKLSHSFEQSSLCFREGPCCLSILNTAVCTSSSQTSYLSFPLALPPGNHRFFLCFFLFYK